MNLDLSGKKIYIEAGANDGVSQSRSLEFVNNPDYFGILIEPHPHAMSKCMEFRNNGRTVFVHSALVSNDYGGDTIEMHPHSQWNLMTCVSDSLMYKSNPSDYSDEKFSVPANTLQAILDGLNVTDVEWFFLDVEGYELEVLRGIDEKTTIRRLETEQHLKTNYEKELNDIVEECRRLNLTYHGKWVPAQGHPKLHFINYGDNE